MQGQSRRVEVDEVRAVELCRGRLSKIEDTRVVMQCRNCTGEVAVVRAAKQDRSHLGEVDACERRSRAEATRLKSQCNESGTVGQGPLR
ncbi:hypothetical protein NDU88_008431 [Pleurodeles waltl]|uniref:Uncharacterized protein n=1 Tax=Pleurodeles waltl TaxID=8319 RepID=A0AAV7N9Q2_PLEWA|nr:hypothetical protein NDU88_008431 [Pleurodeles waltl]